MGEKDRVRQASRGKGTVDCNRRREPGPFVSLPLSWSVDDNLCPQRAQRRLAALPGDPEHGSDDRAGGDADQSATRSQQSSATSSAATMTPPSTRPQPDRTRQAADPAIRRRKRSWFDQPGGTDAGMRDNPVSGRAASRARIRPDVAASGSPPWFRQRAACEADCRPPASRHSHRAASHRAPPTQPRDPKEDSSRPSEPTQRLRVERSPAHLRHRCQQVRPEPDCLPAARTSSPADAPRCRSTRGFRAVRRRRATERSRRWCRKTQELSAVTSRRISVQFGSMRFRYRQRVPACSDRRGNDLQGETLRRPGRRPSIQE